MPINTAGSVWRLILHGQVYGQPVDNVFYYGLLGVGGSAGDLTTAFVASIKTPLEAVLSVQYQATSIEVQGVRFNSDLLTTPIAWAGDEIDDSEPTFVAWGYRFNRVLAGERHGYKRFAGVPDTWIIDGSYDPTKVIYLENLADALAANLTGGDFSYQPLIQRRQANNVVLTVPEYYEFDTCSFQGVTTQNTRKS